MTYIITYHDDKNKLQRYTQQEYDSEEITQKEIDYYIENKYQDARFLHIMEAKQYYKITDKR